MSAYRALASSLGEEKFLETRGRYSYGRDTGVPHNFRAILWSNIYLKDHGVSENVEEQ